MPVGVAGVGAAAAAVVALVVMVAGTETPHRPRRPRRAARATGSTPTGPAPAADPVLGPLPYLLLDDPTLSVTSVDATVGPPTATGPDTGEAGWHVQSYETAAGLGGPRVQVLTVPYLDADGPDDIGHTYGDADTDRVTVQGEPANLLTRDRFAGLWWPGGGDGGVLLSAWDVAADELVALADGLVARSGGGAGGWDASTLPSGLALTVDVPRGSDVTVPWWSANVQYVRVGVEGTGPSLSISTGGAVAFADMTAPSPFQSIEPVTVDGRPGALIAMADGADHRLLWRHSDTTIGEIWAMGTTRDEVVAMAAAIREVGEDEWVASLPPTRSRPPGRPTCSPPWRRARRCRPASSWDGFLQRDSSSSPAADAVLVGSAGLPVPGGAPRRLRVAARLARGHRRRRRRGCGCRGRRPPHVGLLVGDRGPGGGDRRRPARGDRRGRPRPARALGPRAHRGRRRRSGEGRDPVVLP